MVERWRVQQRETVLDFVMGEGRLDDLCVLRTGPSTVVPLRVLTNRLSARHSEMCSQVEHRRRIV